jgi:putative effector of murein hydrolase
VSLVSGIAVARLARLDPVITMSLAPKSVAAPIAVEIASLLGGDEALTAAFVIATGALGSMLGSWFLSRIRIANPVARGLAVGTTAHGHDAPRGQKRRARCPVLRWHSLRFSRRSSCQFWFPGLFTSGG